MTQQFPITEPSLYDTMQLLKRDIFASLNCVKVGQIQSFDASKKTATVQILFKRTGADGNVYDYPLLVGCPVFTLQGGGGAIEFPISAGDQCLVLFSDRNLDAWVTNGGTAAPLDQRCHDLSDGICLVGVNAMTSTLSDYQHNMLRLFYSGAELDLSSASVVLKSASSGAELDLVSGAAALKNGSGGVVSVSAASLISLHNSTISLLTLLQNLVTVISGLSTVPGGGPLNAASISALTAYSATLSTLLA